MRCQTCIPKISWWNLLCARDGTDVQCTQISGPVSLCQKVNKKVVSLCRCSQPKWEHTHTIGLRRDTDRHTHKCSCILGIFGNFGIFCKFHFTHSIVLLSRFLLLVQQQSKQVVWVKVQLFKGKREIKRERKREGLTKWSERFCFQTKPR